MRKRFQERFQETTLASELHLLSIIIAIPTPDTNADILLASGWRDAKVWWYSQFNT